MTLLNGIQLQNYLFFGTDTLNTLPLNTFAPKTFGYTPLIFDNYFNTNWTPGGSYLNFLPYTGLNNSISQNYVLPATTPSFSLSSAWSDGISFLKTVGSKAKKEITNIKQKATKYGQNVRHSISKAIKSATQCGGFPLCARTLNGQTVYTYAGIDIDRLKPEMKDKLIKLTKEAEKHGYKLFVSSGFRSHSSQASLKKRKPGLAASAYKSAHEYGCALDLGLINEKGQKVDIKNVPWFYNYATKNLGLEWGQNWKSKKESWHFNLKSWQYRTDVRREYIACNGRLPNGERA